MRVSDGRGDPRALLNPSRASNACWSWKNVWPFHWVYRAVMEVGDMQDIVVDLRGVGTLRNLLQTGIATY